MFKSTPTVLCLLVYLASLLLAACGGKQEAKAPPPPKVSFIHPVEREVVEWDEYTGRLESPQSVEVRPRVSGYLASIHFRDGQMVKAGELLFVIDPRPYEATMARATAALAQAGAQRELARTNYARAQELQQKKVIAQQELDTRVNEVRAADAAVADAEAQVASAKLNLAFTHVTAPINGRVSRYQVSVGNLIAGGEGTEGTLLTTIVSLDPLYCYFEVDDQSFLKYSGLSSTLRRPVENDPSAPQTAEGLPIEMKVGDADQFDHTGQLSFVDNQVDQQTSTIQMRGTFPNADLDLTPGLFARVRLPGREKAKAILIPDDAVNTNQSLQFALVVGEDGKVQQKPVQLGPLAEGLRVVRKGLTPKDRVIVSGLLKAKPGTEVEAEETSLDKVLNSGDAPPSAAKAAAEESGEGGAKPDGDVSGEVRGAKPASTPAIRRSTQ